MIELKLLNKNPNEVMEIVKELRSQKMVQGIDFDFAYHPGGSSAYTVFTFHTEKSEKYATLFALKYL